MFHNNIVKKKKKKSEILTKFVENLSLILPISV